MVGCARGACESVYHGQQGSGWACSGQVPINTCTGRGHSIGQSAPFTKSPKPPSSPLNVPAARAQRASQAVQGERAGILDDMARLTVEAAAVGRALKVGQAAGCAAWLTQSAADVSVGVEEKRWCGLAFDPSSLQSLRHYRPSPPLLCAQAAAREQEGREDPQSLHPATPFIGCSCRPPPRSGRAGLWRWT